MHRENGVLFLEADISVTTENGQGPMVIIYDPDGYEVEAVKHDYSIGEIVCRLVPEKEGQYKITLFSLDDKELSFDFHVGDASKIKVKVSGICHPDKSEPLITGSEPWITVSKSLTRHYIGYVGYPLSLEVDCRRSGEGKLKLRREGQYVNSIDIIGFTETAKGIYTFVYIPESPGFHCIYVHFGGTGSVPGASPLVIAVNPNPNFNSVKPNIRYFDQKMHADIDLSMVFEHPDTMSTLIPCTSITATVTAPSGEESFCDVKDRGDGRGFELEYTPEQVGMHELDVTFDGILIPDGPFQFEVTKRRGKSNFCRYLHLGPSLFHIALASNGLNLKRFNQILK